jgi:hypothetical protein
MHPSELVNENRELRGVQKDKNTYEIGLNAKKIEKLKTDFMQNRFNLRK